MDLNDSTPRKYPLRKRVKVKYYEDFETSLDLTPSQQPASTSSFIDDTDKENDTSAVIDESMEEEPLSDYEKLRLKNMEENRRMMIQLGLIDPNKPPPKEKNIEKKPKLKTNKVVKTKIKSNAPLKRSLRLLQKTPEGKELSAISFDSTFEDTPEIPVAEQLPRIEEEELPMDKDGKSIDMLERLKQSLCSESSSQLDSSEIVNLISNLKSLKFAKLLKLTPSRIQGLSVHPNQSKLFVYGGSTHGEVAICNVFDGDISLFNPHKRPVNCLTVDNYDPVKLLTTSHDGTIRQGDINKGVFKMVYQTDEDRNMCHLTWHSQVDANTLLVAHGIGQVGIIDMRVSQGQGWFHCHPRSVRTTHLHPTSPQYFLTSSGTGECKIWDLRMAKNKIQEPVSELLPEDRGKGLTSAFFSPDGNKVVSTCNDDTLIVHDTSDLSKPVISHRILHNNHTGRWLSVFKAVWHPSSSDLIFVGSLIKSPRRIQMYNSRLQLLKELMDDEVTTVSSVIALHPSLPVVVGGNSTGKVHIFTSSAMTSNFS